MRNILIFVSLSQVIACHGSSPGAPAPDATPDAGVTPDAMPGDTPPTVAPCGILGLPGPPLIKVGPGTVHLRDLDGDGKLDLIVVGSTEVSVMLGHGDTSFGASIDSALDGTPIDSVAVADLDGDGHLDLVLTHPASIQTLLGDGAGRFTRRLVVPANAARASAVADLDGDGKPDLVLAGGTVRVRLGIGDGTFGAEKPFATRQGPTVVAIADLDGDGIPDVIAASELDTTVNVLAGVGDGTLKAAVNQEGVSTPTQLVATDLNGDGKPDLVIGSHLGGVGVLLNAGNGTLGAVVAYPVGEPQNSELVGLAVDDVNHDDKPDVVALVGHQVVVLAGTADGTLVSPTVVSRVLSEAHEIVLGDVSGDGALDVMIAKSRSSTVSVLQRDGSGGWFAATPYGAVGRADAAVAATDLNGDGNLDLVLFTAGKSELPSSGPVSVALGTPGGGFTDPVVVTQGGRVRVQDITGDGIADLIVSRGYGGLTVLAGRGDGAFLDPVSISKLFADVVAIGDVDGDGKLDLVVAQGAGLAELYAGHGDGTFQDAGALWQGTRHTFIDSIALGDLNHDGKLDVVVAHDIFNCAECDHGTPGLEVLLNQGDGTLSPGFHSPVAENEATLVDLDGDGKLDLVTTGSGGALVRHGVGDGDLQAAVSYPTEQAGELRVVDLTGDGKLDLVTGSFFPGGLSVLPGNGDGTFQPKLAYANAVQSIAVADVNHDGRLDIITASATSGGAFDVSFARCVR